MKPTKICPCCEKGELFQKTETVTMNHKGNEKEILSKYKLCDYCNSEIADSDDLSFNKEQSLKLKKEIDKKEGYESENY